MAGVVSGGGGGAMVQLDYSRARAYCACIRCGRGCSDIFTLIYPVSPLSPSLWETARYRLKCCLKGPLNPKQPIRKSDMASDAKACFSSKDEYRAVIWYLYLKGKTSKEIHGELAVERCRTSLEDEGRSGRPLDATDEEMCKKIRDLVFSDRRIQVEEIVQALSI